MTRNSTNHADPPLNPATPVAEWYAPDQAQLESLWRESKSIHGVSLWTDARRRFLRNRIATASLLFLSVVFLAAFFTPLLPLQSPLDKDLDERRNLPPEFVAHSLGSRPGLEFVDGRLTAELRRWEDELDVLRQRLGNAQTAAEARELSEQIEHHQATNHPFDQLWHDLGPVAWQMTRLRVALFGDYAIPSLAGTDALGRDLLSRLFWGSRISLVVGLVATSVSLVIGVSYGSVAGYLGGTIDAVMMRIVDVLYSVPFIFVVILLITFLGEDSVRATLEANGIDQIMIFYVVIGAIYWLTMARVVRGQIIALRHEQFVEAALVLGASRPRIIFRHLVPNVLGVVIVYLTLTIPAVMLFEAFLSFLGLGVSPPEVSWGLLMNEGIGALSSVRTYWWMVLFPGFALTATLFALNFMGDGLRDALDPRMKNR